MKIYVVKLIALSGNTHALLLFVARAIDAKSSDAEVRTAREAQAASGKVNVNDESVALGFMARM